MESIVLKLNIHLYLHLIYVISPANGKKNEYQSLVSPIVRNGGRSNENHNKAIKVPNKIRPKAVNVHALFLAPLKALHDPIIQNRTDGMAKYINQSQLIIFYNLLIVMLLGSDEHAHSTQHHHDNSNIYYWKPRI